MVQHYKEHTLLYADRTQEKEEETISNDDSLKRIEHVILWSLIVSFNQAID